VAPVLEVVLVYPAAEVWRLTAERLVRALAVQPMLGCGCSDGNTAGGILG